MLSESESRVAQLAISWYGADEAAVERVISTVQTAQARGTAVDLLDALRQARLLTDAQALQLGFGLARTQVDLHAPKRPTRAIADARTPPLHPSEQTPRPARPDPRQVGPYRVLRRLGEGGMGAVYLAYDAARQRQVAVKVLAPEHAAVPNYLARFRREARHGALLAHPHIVRTCDFGQDPTSGLHYLVLEYVPGVTAHELLERHGRLAVGDALAIALDVAGALHYAHARAVIHRDLKPANVLITASGRAKLADLGLAKKLDDPAAHLTASHQGFGTPFYVAPEQALNARSADARSDLYALGATLYHLLTGAVPFPGDSAVEIAEKKEGGVYPPAHTLNPAVPPALDTILARLLARDPAHRYPSAPAVLVDLHRLRLAATLPSFVDPDLAQRLPAARAPQPTRPDLTAAPLIALRPAAVPDTCRARLGGSAALAAALCGGVLLTAAAVLRLFHP